MNIEDYEELYNIGQEIAEVGEKLNGLKDRIRAVKTKVEAAHDYSVSEDSESNEAKILEKEVEILDDAIDGLGKLDSYEVQISLENIEKDAEDYVENEEADND